MLLEVYKGEAIGSCKYSDFCVFSFHAIKSLLQEKEGLFFQK